jgi:hypothetical protein
MSELFAGDAAALFKTVAPSFFAVQSLASIVRQSTITWAGWRSD